MSFIGNVPAEAYSPVAKDTFSGNDSTTDFTLSIPATTNSVEVFVENVQQEPTTAYTISGTTLSFTAAPVTGTNNIYVIHRGPAVQQIVPPAGVAIDASTVTASGLVTAQDGLVVDNDGATVATFDRATSDGTIAEFQKDGTTVGAIGVANGDNFYIASDDTTDVGLKFDGDANAIYACDAVGGIRDNAVTLGDPAVRFKDLYLSGGVYLGGTVAANKLDDYEEGTYTPVYSTSGGGESVSYSAQQGKYVKVGSLVYFNVVIYTSGSSGFTGGSGSIRVSLPFTSNGGDQRGASCGEVTQWTTKSPEAAYIVNGTNQATLLYNNGAGSATITTSNINASGINLTTLYGCYQSV